MTSATGEHIMAVVDSAETSAHFGRANDFRLTNLKLRRSLAPSLIVCSARSTTAQGLEFERLAQPSHKTRCA